jgi:hypothetical protein
MVLMVLKMSISGRKVKIKKIGENGVIIELKTLIYLIEFNENFIILSQKFITVNYT